MDGPYLRSWHPPPMKTFESSLTSDLGTSPRQVKIEKVGNNQGASRNSKDPESEASWRNKRLPPGKCGLICNPERILGDQVGMANKRTRGRGNLEMVCSYRGVSQSGGSPGYQWRGTPQN